MSKSTTIEFCKEYVRRQIPENLPFASELGQLFDPVHANKIGHLWISYSQTVIYAYTCLFDADLKRALARAIEPVNILVFAVMRSEVASQPPIPPRVDLVFVNNRMGFAEPGVPGPSWTMTIELSVHAPFITSRLARPQVETPHPEILKCSSSDSTAFSVGSRPLYFEVNASGGGGAAVFPAGDAVPEDLRKRVMIIKALSSLPHVDFSQLRTVLNHQCGGEISSAASVKQQVSELITWADGLNGIGIDAVWGIAVGLFPQLGAIE
jgi:hypothetical protein